MKVKPSRLNKKKLKEWNEKLKILEKEEEIALNELQDAYVDLENFL